MLNHWLYLKFHSSNMKVTLYEKTKSTVAETKCTTPKKAGAGRRQSVIEVQFKFQVFLSFFLFPFSKELFLLLFEFFVR